MKSLNQILFAEIVVLKETVQKQGMAVGTMQKMILGLEKTVKEQARKLHEKDQVLKGIINQYIQKQADTDKVTVDLSLEISGLKGKMKTMKLEIKNLQEIVISKDIKIETLEEE